MKTVDQLSRGAVSFFDAEVRPSLSDGKAIFYGLLVRRAAANAQSIIAQYAPILAPLSIAKDGMIDADGLAADLRDQMGRNGGLLTVRIFADEFTFRPQDVDNLMMHIERA